MSKNVGGLENKVQEEPGFWSLKIINLAIWWSTWNRRNNSSFNCKYLLKVQTCILRI